MSLLIIGFPRIWQKCTERKNSEFTHFKYSVQYIGNYLLLKNSILWDLDPFFFFWQFCAQCVGLTFSTSRHATGHTQGYPWLEVVCGLEKRSAVGAVQVQLLGVLKVMAKWLANCWPSRVEPNRVELDDMLWSTGCLPVCRGGAMGYGYGKCGWKCRVRGLRSGAYL